MNASHPFLQLVLARLREFYREPIVIFWVYGFPLILAVSLGIGTRGKEPEPSVVDVLGPANSASTSSLADALRKAGITVEFVEDEAACRKRLGQGKTMLYIVPQSDGTLEYVYDKMRDDGVLARHRVSEALLRQAAPDRIKEEDKTVTEPGTRYIDRLLPGLIGMNLLGGGMWGIGFAIVDMRVRKLFKRLVATPMRHSHFMLAVFTSRFAVMIPEMVFLLAFGWLVFGVPVRGSLWLIALIILIGASAFSGLGLVVASRTEKTEVVSGLMNAIMIPMWLLSGVFFSYERFPNAMQPFIQALPLTQVNDALRAVMLEGAGLGDIAWHLGILVVWAVATFVLALKIFRWN
jgi:ABC-type multidrug transport system permease subunit